MKTNTFTEIEFNTWSECREYLDKMSENWVFRGQQDSSWDLKTSFERSELFGKHEFSEKEIAARFQTGARNFLSPVQIPQSNIEWLALMQHHGASTRLLDFTESPYIASWFGFENSGPNATCAIWAINTKAVMQRVFAKLEENGISTEKARNPLWNTAYPEKYRMFTSEHFDLCYLRDDLSMVFPIEPLSQPERYQRQQSLFIATGCSSLPFMEQLEFLGEDSKKALLKLSLPMEERPNALRELGRMNINRSTLFPGLDGFAASLNNRYSPWMDFPKNLDRMIAFKEANGHGLYP